MDHRLRELERRAAQGDPHAQQALIYAQCRAYGHDWEREQHLISRFPIIYETFRRQCQRCQYINERLAVEVAKAKEAAARRRPRRRRRRGPKKNR